MLKVAKSSIAPGRTATYEGTTDFSSYPLPYPLRAVKACSYQCKISKVGDYAHAAFVIAASLEVYDSRDGTPFLKKVSVSEDVDILNEEDASGEGFLVDGASIDLDELALRILVSSLPIRLLKDAKESLPKSGAGYRVFHEGEVAPEAAKGHLKDAKAKAGKK